MKNKKELLFRKLIIILYHHILQRLVMETVVFSPTIDAFIAHIDEYLTSFKDLTEANAKEIIEYVKVSLQPLYIKVSYEHLSCLERINKARETSTSAARRFRFILSTN